MYNKKLGPNYAEYEKMAMAYISQKKLVNRRYEENMKTKLQEANIKDMGMF